MAINPDLRIETPRGSVFINQKNMKAKLEWNKNFGPKWTGRLTSAQVWLDNAVLKGCDPYVPFQTGMLIKSGVLGTEIGSGVVQWIAPYARAQYYMANRKQKLADAGTLRGSFWFSRWKAVNAKRVIATVKAMGGGG